MIVCSFVGAATPSCLDFVLFGCVSLPQLPGQHWVSDLEQLLPHERDVRGGVQPECTLRARAVAPLHAQLHRQRYGFRHHFDPWMAGVGLLVVVVGGCWWFGVIGGWVGYKRPLFCRSVPFSSLPLTLLLQCRIARTTSRAARCFVLIGGDCDCAVTVL